MKRAATRQAPHPETLTEIRSDLEGQSARVDSMVGALSYLANEGGDIAPLFFTLMNALEPVNAEIRRIVERVMMLENSSPPKA